jgi:hypothetical protein
MRTLLCGILILLLAGGLTMWPQVAGAQTCPYGRTDCGDVTCHQIGSGNMTAYGGCLAMQAYKGYKCVVQHADAMSSGGGWHVAPSRVLCSPGGTDFNVMDCGDMWVATPQTPDDCDRLWHGCGGIMVNVCGS